MVRDKENISSQQKIFTLDLLALYYDAVLQGMFVVDTCVTGREEQ